MIESRTHREHTEDQTLALWACRTAHTRGRAHRESRHSRRTDFQRDRDRIVNSKCFRRLEYKTQVFVNGTQDHYRTRLTHTIEMTSVARTLARALRVNEDLTAAISLAHDIGHSPFGHSGERALDERMAGHGGFDHNLQSLRWVELLEEDYPEFDGLNLTWEVRAGLRKHVSRNPGAELDGFPVGPWTLAEERVRRQYPDCPADRLASTAIRMLFTLQIEDVLQRADEQLSTLNPQSPWDIMSAPDRAVHFSEPFLNMLKPYRKFLFEEMYFHPDVTAAGDEAVRLMTRLFDHYLLHPEHMGAKARKRLDTFGLHRTVCDYVAGCTDRYALEECAKYRLV